MEYNFVKMPIMKLLAPYDLSSMMHYDRYVSWKKYFCVDFFHEIQSIRVDLSKKRNQIEKYWNNCKILFEIQKCTSIDVQQIIIQALLFSADI